MRETWRKELAEMLARAESEGRELTEAEWWRFCELLPQAERTAVAEYITSTLSPGRVAGRRVAWSPGLQELARG